MTLATILPTILTAVITALFSAVTVYVSINSRIAVVESKIDTLSARVEQHNHVIERTGGIEKDVQNIFHQLDEVKRDIKRLEGTL